MKPIRIKINHLNIREVRGWSTVGRIMSIYIRFTDTKIVRTREVLPEVFADFDKHADIVGLEFIRPGDFDVDAMKTVTEKYHLPSPETIRSLMRDVKPEEVAVAS